MNVSHTSPELAHAMASDQGLNDLNFNYLLEDITELSLSNSQPISESPAMRMLPLAGPSRYKSEITQVASDATAYENPEAPLQKQNGF